MTNQTEPPIAAPDPVDAMHRILKWTAGGCYGRAKDALIEYGHQYAAYALAATEQSRVQPTPDPLPDESTRADRLEQLTDHLPAFPHSAESLWVWRDEEIIMLRAACAKRFGESLRTESLFCIAATGIRIYLARHHPTPDCDGLNSSAKVQIDSELNLSSEISIHEATLEDIIRGRFQLLGYENPITDAREAMNAIRPYLRTTEPVSVDLDDVAMWKEHKQRQESNVSHYEYRKIFKQVLDAAGVKYVD